LIINDCIFERMSKLLVLALVLVSLSMVSGHARMKCPKARDWNDKNGNHIVFDNTGNKNGACGPYSFNYGMGGVVALRANTWQTFVFEESIAHTGAPYRLSILDENELEVFVLLNHIPHNEAAMPIPYVESTYVPYNITIYIPDVQCAKCTIQLIMFMTDKTVKCGIPTCHYFANDSACSGKIDGSPACAGAPNNTPCLNQNTCFSNYHSCIDVTLDGHVPLKNANFPQPIDWPYRSLPDLEYGSEIGTWTGGILQGAPKNFTTFQGVDLC